MRRPAKLPEGYMLLDGGSLATKEGLDVYLTSKAPWIRCAGRGMATGWIHLMAAWVNAERQRGTDPNDIIHALISTQIEIAASFAGQVFNAEGCAVALENYQRMLREHFLEHALLIDEATS